MPPPAPPAAPPFPGFTEPQKTTIGRLSSLLAVLGPLFILVAVARLGLGAVEVWRGNLIGLLHLPEVALFGFVGLALIAGSSDANYLRTVPGREKEHLLNTYTSMNVAYTALLILGSCLAVVYFIRIWM
ncbi:MAG TPA: hypothetical protein VHR72_04285 [Gemmataceae bacterium]|jgi:hypothetical protein|nr:hypothetical protein [Gemmataceae bacterium]